LEEVAMRAGHEVLKEFDDNILLIVGDPQEILELQLRPHPIHLLNITTNVIIILINYIKLCIIILPKAFH
jgi:hypothetical protein